MECSYRICQGQGLPPLGVTDRPADGAVGGRRPSSWADHVPPTARPLFCLHTLEPTQKTPIGKDIELAERKHVTHIYIIEILSMLRPHTIQLTVYRINRKEWLFSSFLSLFLDPQGETLQALETIIAV